MPCTVPPVGIETEICMPYNGDIVIFSYHSCADGNSVLVMLDLDFYNCTKQ